jgi:hypothetical protein
LKNSSIHCLSVASRYLADHDDFVWVTGVASEGSLGFYPAKNVPNVRVLLLLLLPLQPTTPLVRHATAAAAAAATRDIQSIAHSILFHALEW